MSDQSKSVFRDALGGMALFVAASMAGRLHALPVTVLSDNFNSYTNGTLSGQGGWTATAAALTPLQVAGATDKYVQFGTSGQDEYKAFTSAVPHTDGESIETSFSLTASAAQATGDYFLHLSNPAGTTSSFYQRVFAKSSPNGYVLGLTDTSGTGSVTDYGTTELTFGSTNTVDVVWNFVPGGTSNDTFTMMVNGSPYLTHTWSSATVEPTALAAANLRQGSAANSATVQVDNLVVSASSIATPEPTALGLLALGGISMVRRRRVKA